MLAGRTWWDKAWTSVKVEMHELGTWLLCMLMYIAEAFALRGWLESSSVRKGVEHFGSDVTAKIEAWE